MDIINKMLEKRYRRVKPAELNKLKTLTPEERVVVCKHDKALFSAYYFAHTKKYPFAMFHYGFFAGFDRLLAGKLFELVLLGFRESAKTSLVKELIIYLIAYRLEDYIVWDSLDIGNSKRALFDIVVEMQTNKRLKQDFGELYNTKRSKDESTQKTIDSFLTNSIKDEDGNTLHRGIRVEAHSTQESARGFLYDGKRPGVVILDDFESKKSIRSEAITRNIWDHIQELKGGIDGIRFRVIYLGNYISEFANIQKLIDKGKMDHMMEIHNIPAIYQGVPTWFEKYVLTDDEARIYQEVNPKLTPKVSLESKKRLLWSPDTGDQTWQAEMMNNPIDNTIAKFKREYFKNIELQELLKKDVVCFVILDPALSEKDQSDDTGVSIIWVDKENKWYSKVFPVRLNSLELVNFLFYIHEALKQLGTTPRRIGIEKEKYYGAVYPFLKKEMQERNIFLPMYAIEIKGRKKEDRITDALQYRYEAGVIHHVLGSIKVIDNPAPSKDWYTEDFDIPYDNGSYETQALRFPAGGHDDMLDSHAYGADIVRYDAPESEEEKKARTNPYNMDAFVQRIEKKNREIADQEAWKIQEEKHKMNEEWEQVQEDDGYYDEIGG